MYAPLRGVSVASATTLLPSVIARLAVYFSSKGARGLSVFLKKFTHFHVDCGFGSPPPKTVRQS